MLQTELLTKSFVSGAATRIHDDSWLSHGAENGAFSSGIVTEQEGGGGSR